MTECNKKQIRFPVQQQADKEPTQAKIQYGEFVFKTRKTRLSYVHDGASRCAKTNLDSVDSQCVWKC